MSIQIILNGNPHNLGDTTTVAELVGELQLKGRLAIEINQHIVPRSKFGDYKLKAGDRVEIVHAIGGG